VGIQRQLRIVRCNLEGVHPIKWKNQLSGMTVSHLSQLRQLHDENAKSKHMCAGLALMATNQW